MISKIWRWFIDHLLPITFIGLFFVWMAIFSLSYAVLVFHGGGIKDFFF